MSEWKNFVRHYIGKNETQWNCGKYKSDRIKELSPTKSDGGGA